MKTKILLFVFIFISTSFCPAQQTFIKAYGGTGMEKLMHPMLQTPDSGFCLGGPTISFGAGSEDVLLIKTDANGTVQWARTYGGTGTDYRHSAAKSFDGGYIMSGWTNSFGAGMEAFLLKVSGNGTYQWMKTYGWVGTNEFSFSAVQSPDSGYALVGKTSTGAGDILFIKTDINGSLQWARTFGDSSVSDQGMRLINTADNGFLLVSRATSYSAGIKDFLLIKTDSMGNVQWSRTYGGAQDENVYDILQTLDGGYITCGRTLSFGAGSTDALVVKLSSDGSPQWAHTYGDTAFDDFANSIIQNPDGGYTTSGHTKSYGAGSDDCSMMRIDSAGNLLWTKIFGGTQQDENVAIIQTMDGGYALNGFVTSYGAGNNDGVMMKTTANGDISGCLNNVYPKMGNPAVITSSPSLQGTSVTPIVGTPTPTLSSPVLITTDICLRADFTAETILGRKPLEVQFTDLSSGSPTSWLWQFGDGDTSTEQNPVHVYADTGTFTVMLKVKNSIDSSEIQKDNYIRVNPELKASFTAETLSGIIPLTVNFTDNSTGEPSGWYWDFGDDSSSTEQNPVHVYQTSGTFTVALTISDGNYNDTKTLPDYIIVNRNTGVENWDDSSLKTYNYPNPFNTETRIYFIISNRENITLKIFDILGREVATLINGEVDAGENVVLFDGRNLGNGIYFYVLKNKNETIRRLMIKSN